ncbi:spore germination protein [Bacillus taeanensis]|uniref:Spore germination protein n=1 Tax=Bacillus taeanensis TaxID=273032 RepID=A0A366XLT0_9BACI|nr:spore germination protein [Bacillus taeanensis]RBW67330.1 spore germination protein [Bacillus taeanensis]
MRFRKDKSKRKQFFKWSSSNLEEEKSKIENSNSKPLHTHLLENLAEIRRALGHSNDLVIRKFRIGKEGKICGGAVYIDGLVDKDLVHEMLDSFMYNMRNVEITVPNDEFICTFDEMALANGETMALDNFNALYDILLSGDTIFLFDECKKSIATATKGWDHRSVSEPTSQIVVRGPQEAFTETLRTNTALIRRKIKDPNLWIEARKIGSRTKTDIAVMYIKDIADENVVQEIHRRLDEIEIDAILESGYIEELIQDEAFTPFPTIYNSERPDSIAAGLLEGRVAILVDGTPFVLLVPALFTQFLQSAEDYYHRSDFGLLRMLRLVAMFISLLAPSLYIAVTTFHQEMLQTTLLISIAAQREGIPFPAFIEALLMEFTFEILREAGVRMPRAVGSAISIVGALVLGEAAVQAGLVSPAMVIVVSITAISSFIFPVFSLSIPIRMLRFALMGLAASFGLFGIIVGLIALVLHLSSLKSFGVPYLSPMAPMNFKDQKDTFFRFPIWDLNTRPHLIGAKNYVRGRNKAPKKQGKSTDHTENNNNQGGSS